MNCFLIYTRLFSCSKRKTVKYSANNIDFTAFHCLYCKMGSLGVAGVHLRLLEPIRHRLFQERQEVGEVGTLHLLYSHNQEDQTSCAPKGPSLPQMNSFPSYKKTANTFKERQLNINYIQYVDNFYRKKICQTEKMMSHQLRNSTM